MGVAPDLAVLDDFEVPPEPEAPPVVVAAVVDVAVLGNKMELVNVVHSEEAGMTGAPPGGA
jgi:hypothetical protein